ncbi:hypothetical protein TNCV_163841 [Trichonephila clavipes]|nr:hypothetical protein TNCV_163841 [Trichonephila clavipes]
MEIAERKETGRFRAEDEGSSKWSSKTQKKLIELEGGHFTRACLREYSQDKSGIGKFCVETVGLSSESYCEDTTIIARTFETPGKEFDLSETTKTISTETGRLGGETRTLDLKIVDPAWMKKGFARKLRENEIEFRNVVLNDVPIESDHSKKIKPQLAYIGDRGRGVAET